MTLEQYALIGEIIASIAVVISVLYLAVQVRQSTVVTRREAFESTISRIIHHWLDEVAASGDAAQIYHRGLEDI